MKRYGFKSGKQPEERHKSKRWVRDLVVVKLHKKWKADFDVENDILFLYSDKKSEGSVNFKTEFGSDIILDFDKKEKVVSIEILNASLHGLPVNPGRKKKPYRFPDMRLSK